MMMMMMMIGRGKTRKYHKIKKKRGGGTGESFTGPIKRSSIKKKGGKKIINGGLASGGHMTA